MIYQWMRGYRLSRYRKVLVVLHMGAKSITGCGRSRKEAKRDALMKISGVA